ncbi:MAG: IMP dehydrogenase [Patescibacteria group bacterium]|nr:IMP dehydrogenase [Patescibacteria group bacterium]
MELGLTFDDVLLLPDYSDFSRSEINLSTNFTKKIKLLIPLVSAPMDTVTESKLAISLAKLGGIGIIHRNLSIKDQVGEVLKVKSVRAGSDQKLLVGAAVGASQGFEERVKAIVKAGVDTVVVDSAHGYSKNVIDAVSFIKNTFPKMEVVGGNIATFDGARALIAAGCDALRVGMGPGSICTTRIVSGMGVPQVTALKEACRAAKKSGTPVIADGGIKNSGDMVKALAVGASTVMMGSFFASSVESPGKTINLSKDQVPGRFQSILNHKTKKYLFKQYRGMGSLGAMEKGAKTKSEDEFHGKNYKDRILVAEGVEGLVPVKGTVEEMVGQTLGGIKSGMYYVGAKTINELWRKANFIQITQASLVESYPHNILITNTGKP